MFIPWFKIKNVCKRLPNMTNQPWIPEWLFPGLGNKFSSSCTPAYNLLKEVCSKIVHYVIPRWTTGNNKHRFKSDDVSRTVYQRVYEIIPSCSWLYKEVNQRDAVWYVHVLHVVALHVMYNRHFITMQRGELKWQVQMLVRWLI